MEMIEDFDSFMDMLNDTLTVRRAKVYVKKDGKLMQIEKISTNFVGDNVFIIVRDLR